MTHSVLEVTNGPAKDDLLRAVANTDDQLTTLLDTPAGLLETRIGRLEELGDDGVTFTLWGQLTSLELRGATSLLPTIAPVEPADLPSNKRPSGSRP